MDHLLQPGGRLRRGTTPLGLGRVYENLVGVLATRHWLEEHGRIRIPLDNRPLVEAVTNRAGLRDHAHLLGGAWPDHLEAHLCEKGVEGGAAASVMIDWGQPLADNQSVPNLEARTRLGLLDRRVEFPEALAGPFGKSVSVLNLPGWMAQDIPEEAGPEEVAISQGAIRFRLGERSFIYDRFGLRKADR